jgi:phosphatidylglycerol:prolipoprotein diacylglycerol transferase
VIVHPILFHLPSGPPVYAYGTMLCLAVILGRLVAVRLAERDGLDPALMHRCCVWTLVAALVGARLLYVVTNLDQFKGVLDVFAWWKGGAAAYGGFLGGFLGTVAFCRVHRVSALAWADCAVPALALGLLLTRIGCFLGGCDFGQPWDGAWAVRFPVGSPAYEQQAAQGLLPLDATRSLPVHPTQLYESLAGLVLLGLVMAVRRLRRVPGQAFVSFVAGYAVVRYVIETLRADADRGTVGALSTSQFIAVATLLSAAALAYVLHRRRVPLPAVAEPTRARRP